MVKSRDVQRGVLKFDHLRYDQQPCPTGIMQEPNFPVALCVPYEHGKLRMAVSIYRYIN